MNPIVGETWEHFQSGGRVVIDTVRPDRIWVRYERTSDGPGFFHMRPFMFTATYRKVVSE